MVRRVRLCRVVIGAAIVLMLAGCSGTTTEERPADEVGKPVVYVVNYPLQYFAERIAGGAVEVEFPAPPDEDPAYWQPDTETIGAYQQADLILLNGAGYAKWVPMASLPTSRLVDTSHGFSGRYIELERALTHSHGPGGEHEHGGVAFTTWLDFSLAVEQARAIKDALVKLLPDEQAQFESNLAELEGDLLDLDAQMKDVAAELGDEPLVASHPVYQYWSRGYGLNVESVHWEPDETPSEEMWAELADLLSPHPANTMIWEGDPMDESVEGLAARGLDSTVFDPCGNTPEEGDLMSVMKQNIENLQGAL